MSTRTTRDLDVWFDTLGTFTLSASTTVRVRLGERTDGYVVAGPMRFVNTTADRA